MMYAPPSSASSYRCEGKEAVKTCQELIESGVSPSRRMWLAALKACINSRDLQTGKKIHAGLSHSGLDRNLTVANTLMHMYAKCKSMKDARWVFDRMLFHDSISWNTLIFGYAKNGDAKLALQLFHLMHKSDCSPDARTFVAALKAVATCAEAKQEEGEVMNNKSEWLRVGIELHSQAAKGGFESDMFVACTLVDMYAKCGKPCDARLVFDRMHSQDIVSWNALLFGEHGDVVEQFAVMREEGCSPDAVSYVAALKACASCAVKEVGSYVDGRMVKARWLRRGAAIHWQARKDGFEQDMMVASTLVDMYSNCGASTEAREVFDGMLQRDVVAWNAVIFGHAESDDQGDHQIAVELFARMQEESLKCRPNSLTYVAVLKACGSLAVLEDGKRIHAQVCNAGVESDSYVATSLVDFYGKCGGMSLAQQVFDSVRSTRHLATWNVLIAGYTHQGDCVRAFVLFEQMRQERLQVDGITFLYVLTLCSRAGLVERGKEYFALMQTRECWNMRPDLQHYSCMVDLLCRANRLDDAVKMVSEMDVEGDIALWRTILGACHKWRNAEIGRVAFEAAVRLDDKEPAAYVLMANIYASAGMMSESARIQSLIQAKQTTISTCFQ